MLLAALQYGERCAPSGSAAPAVASAPCHTVRTVVDPFCVAHVCVLGVRTQHVMVT